MLAELPSGLEIIIPVICGNDCYKKGKIVAFDNAWLVDVEELCELAAKKASRCFAVVGGSAAIWKYEESLSVDQCLLFNGNVQRLRDGFAAKNVESISGAIELQGIQLGDKIGHVSDASERIVFDAFVTWVIRGHEIVHDIASVVVEGACVSEEPVQVVANACIQEDTSRAYGFVPMERGEFSACAAQLKSASVYAETPADFIDVLDDAFFSGGSQLVCYCEVRPCPGSLLVG